MKPVIWILLTIIQDEQVSGSRCRHAAWSSMKRNLGDATTHVPNGVFALRGPHAALGLGGRMRECAPPLSSTSTPRVYLQCTLGHSFSSSPWRPPPPLHCLKHKPRAAFSQPHVWTISVDSILFPARLARAEWKRSGVSCVRCYFPKRPNCRTEVGLLFVHVCVVRDGIEHEMRAA